MIARDFKMLLLVLSTGCWLCFGGTGFAQNESLPEMVKRHDQEIKSLKEAVDSLKALQQPKPSSDQKTAISGCERDLKIIGRYGYTQQQLNDVATIKDTGIVFKLIRASASPYSIMLASNVDALNNKTLLQGSSYKFSLRNCNYVLLIEDVTPGATNSMLTVFLNYE